MDGQPRRGLHLDGLWLCLRALFWFRSPLFLEFDAERCSDVRLWWLLWRSSASGEGHVLEPGGRCVLRSGPQTLPGCLAANGDTMAGMRCVTWGAVYFKTIRRHPALRSRRASTRCASSFRARSSLERSRQVDRQAWRSWSFMVALPLGWGKVRVSEGEPEGPHWVFTSWDGRRMRLEDDGLGAVRPLDVPGGEEA